ncbi:oligoendopeptidase F [Halorubrum lacusprofundi]|jgi:oligoendopeptidase F|uniref:Oligoendopeptidase F n=1 Tax=Halorubrum lacusprofundi (strain ATCC 49239 / DSM 5036 / JCM 8891 / ACAM 34) TaxID=416348 RepID=B9LU63_HALLT|nr:oligoendopeptidase F [Halorubrum lacusprofundi]ACM58257.1 oligoendopeptidase F [Halorubrum lacusprofundi ATCC 49239]MCG1006339.1 oligoendopeptidase F [Halorubrum lacusprofundi]
MSSVPERAEIDEAYKWDLQGIYADDEEWESAYEAVSERIEELEAYEGRVADDAATLLELLELREAIFRDLEQVMTYAQLRSAEDTRNQEYQAMSAKASSLGSEASSTISYLEPELQSLTEADVAAFVDDEPALAEYEHYLDDVLRMKAHTRSAEVEEVLADLSEVTDAPSEIYSMLTNADMTYGVVENPDGEEVEITQANFTKLQKNPDRKFRERVHETFYDEWAGVRNTVGTSLKKAVREHATSAEIRGYDSARQAALDGSNVPVEVYDTLVDTVDDNLDVLHRHAELKADALGVDQLESHDLYMSLTGDQGPDVAYEQAREWVIEAVAPLGEAYQERMAEGLDSRWVDVYENRGKRSGAFSSGTYDTQPYILMNYQDDIASMFTLAHELGHSMHSELSGDTQPWHDASYDIFVAEIASTVNETLLTHHLLDTVEDDELRTHVLDEYLERFRSTLFRQTMFAAFEQRIHERVEADDALTPDAFDEIYADLKGDYYAPAELTGGVEREWERIPHFYYNFYVYQYATGISAAAAIVERVLDEGDEAAADYREMLRAGGSDYPLDVVELAGIDMASPEPIESAVGIYDEYLDEIAALLDVE